MRITPKIFYKKLLGNIGEKKSVKFLRKTGYEILETNYKTKIGEIDIIAKDKDVIVFVEVKTRSSEKYGNPSEAVDKNKRLKYKKVAEEYLIRKYNSIDVSSRFDVLEVIDDKINHIIDAFSL